MKLSKSSSPARLRTSSPETVEDGRTGYVPTRFLPLATYAAQRTLVGRPLLEDLKLLVPADNTVRETREILSAGRGNVKEDLIKNDYDSSRRTLAARRTLLDIKDEFIINPLESAHIGAALGAESRAGNCGEHTAIGLRVHSNKLVEGQVVKSVASLKKDHTWAVQTHAPGNAGPSIVIDPWSRGPAVMLRDASDLHRGLRKSTYSVSVNKAEKMRKGFEEAQILAKEYVPVIQDHIRSMKNDNRRGIREVDTYSETKVTSPEFRRSAGDSAKITTDLMIGKTPQAQHPNVDGPIYKLPALNMLLSIVAAARELNVSVKGAAAFAKKVIAKLTPSQEP